MDSEHAAVDVVLDMAPTDQKTEVVSPAEMPEDLPLPSDPKVIFLGGLFPWWSIRPVGAGGRLCREGDRVAICLCYRRAGSANLDSGISGVSA